MNIQDKMQEIHHKYGVSEMANYKIQLFIDALLKEQKEQLILSGVVKSLPDLEFINSLDGELCDYKTINKICNRKDDAQDVLRKVVKKHYKIDM
ncbi:hypothetical protein [uncultured Polaribacter sp.]|uniref:hypothetical protein n=1 Tax=uncultured Polaribacter sp. TaxID=174711 RepID=UPI00260533DE|nr:hypothetical protein [uncultured Polaribacter sp.]